VRVYTIAIGKSGGKSQQVVAQLPDGEAYTANVDNSADPQTLKGIATTTGGLFYQADTGDKLARIYTDIDGLEKTKSKLIQHDRFYEAYQPFGCAVSSSLSSKYYCASRYGGAFLSFLNRHLCLDLPLRNI